MRLSLHIRQIHLSSSGGAERPSTSGASAAVYQVRRGGRSDRSLIATAAHSFAETQFVGHASGKKRRGSGDKTPPIRSADISDGRSNYGSERREISAAPPHPPHWPSLGEQHTGCCVSPFVAALCRVAFGSCWSFKTRPLPGSRCPESVSVNVTPANRFQAKCHSSAGKQIIFLFFPSFLLDSHYKFKKNSIPKTVQTPAKYNESGRHNKSNLTQ